MKVNPKSQGEVMEKANPHLVRIHTLVAERRVLSEKVKSLWAGIVEVRKLRAAKSDEIKRIHVVMRQELADARLAAAKALTTAATPAAPTTPVVPAAPAKVEAPKPTGIGDIAQALKKAVTPAKNPATQNTKA